jgi:alkanesulfonate monooxygenase SsuD/methylene tetrahydromethanopterin reductase-like flavin-dependent oxidoreductase (luciferase family)
MRFGFLIRPQDPPTGERAHARWQEMLTSARIAEEVGFDGVFLAEHHGMPDWAGSSPWGPLGAIAATTERVEIGTTVHVLPLQNPFSVAEHAATVDVMSGGRLRLGVGVGFVAEEAELYGLDPELRNERFEEGIEIVQRLWAGETLDHHGDQYDVSGACFPRPLGAELWVGGMSGPGARRAGRLGAAWPTGLVHGIGVMSYLTDEYRRCAAEAGHPERARVCLLRDAWVADSLEDVEAQWWPHARAEHFWLFSRLPDWVANREPYDSSVAEQDFSFARHHVDRLIVGSPQDCIEKIRRFRDELDMDYLIMSFRQGSGPSAAEEVESIRRFGTEVIPAFRTTR